MLCYACNKKSQSPIITVSLALGSTKVIHILIKQHQALNLLTDSIKMMIVLPSALLKNRVNYFQIEYALK